MVISDNRLVKHLRNCLTRLFHHILTLSI